MWSSGNHGIPVCHSYLATLPLLCFSSLIWGTVAFVYPFMDTPFPLSWRAEGEEGKLDSSFGWGREPGVVFDGKYLSEMLIWDP